MSAQMLASSVAAQAVAPRFGKKATGVSARKAISKAPIGGHRVQAAPKAVFAVNAAAGKKTAIVTGASSGLGLYTTKALVDRGDYHVVMAVRDVAKGEAKAKELGFPADSYTVMELELGDLKSVRNFAKKFRGTPKLSKQFQALICNAAIYFPNAVEPTYTKDGFEETVGVTHLGHFLLANLLLQDLVKADDMGIDKRLCIVGSVTANTNTLAGQVPPRANLGDMAGLAAGLNGDRNGGAMIDGERFIGPKAYKDAKLCNILTVKEMSNRWHEETGVTFSTMYPGCIADTPLFRNHTPTFRFLFPIIQKYITKGYVSMQEAGGRLASVVCEPQYTESGAYWAWKGGGDQLWDNYWDNDNRNEAFNNKTSKEGGDMLKAKEMFDMSARVVGLKESEMGPKGGGGVKMPSLPKMPAFGR